MIDNPFAAISRAPASESKPEPVQKAGGESDKPFSNEMEKAEVETRQPAAKNKDSVGQEPENTSNPQKPKTRTESAGPSSVDVADKTVNGQESAVTTSEVIDAVVEPVAVLPEALSIEAAAAANTKLDEVVDAVAETGEEQAPLLDDTAGELIAPPVVAPELIKETGPVKLAEQQQLQQPVTSSPVLSQVPTANVTPGLDNPTVLSNEADVGLPVANIRPESRKLVTDSEKPVPAAVVTELQRLTTLSPDRASPEKTLLQLAESLGIQTEGEVLDNRVMTQLKEALTANLQASTSGSSPAASQPLLAKGDLSVTIPFAQNNWGEAVSEKVLWMASKGVQSADIQLDPPELGPLQVKISVENDQAHVSFVASNNSVKDALDQNAARLREMFDSEGIDLVDVDVSSQSEQQGGEEAGGDGEQSTASAPVDGADDESPVVSEVRLESGIDAYV